MSDVSTLFRQCSSKFDPLLFDYHYDVSSHVIDFFKNKNIPFKKLLELQKKIPVIYPWDSEYDKLRQNSNFRLVVFPMIILMATNVNDITYLFSWCRKFNIPLSIRSGGHCYEPFSLSSGVVFDQSRRQHFRLHSDNTITLEAGITIGKMAKKLSEHDLAIPTGTCANVGVAGLTLGGGVGFLERKYGLTCDNLLEFKIILASGEHVTCNSTNYSDLFWACRGAGGGNFGIITEFKYKTHYLPQVILYELSYPLDDLVDIFDMWQRFAPFAPDELGSAIEIYYKDKPFVITGEYIGTEKDLCNLLSPFIAKCKNLSLKSVNYIDAVRHYSGSQRRPYFFKNKNHFAYKFLSPADIRNIQRFMENAGPFDFIEVLAFGGAISRVNPSDTAFYHRKALYWILYHASWFNHSDEANKLAWVNELYDSMVPSVGTHTYINWPDTTLSNPLNSYYGTNIERLVRVKNIYDPDNVFNFQHSIPLHL